jgi:hypothetical protein
MADESSTPPELIATARRAREQQTQRHNGGEVVTAIERHLLARGMAEEVSS